MSYPIEGLLDALLGGGSHRAVNPAFFMMGILFLTKFHQLYSAFSNFGTIPIEGLHQNTHDLPQPQQLILVNSCKTVAVLLYSNTSVSIICFHHCQSLIQKPEVSYKLIPLPCITVAQNLFCFSMVDDDDGDDA